MSKEKLYEMFMQYDKETLARTLADIADATFGLCNHTLRDTFSETQRVTDIQNKWCKCPSCGSYNYEVGGFTTGSNVKCNDCGRLFWYNFNTFS